MINYDSASVGWGVRTYHSERTWRPSRNPAETRRLQSVLRRHSRSNFDDAPRPSLPRTARAFSVSLEHAFHLEFAALTHLSLSTIAPSYQHSLAYTSSRSVFLFLIFTFKQCLRCVSPRGCTILHYSRCCYISVSRSSTSHSSLNARTESFFKKASTPVGSASACECHKTLWHWALYSGCIVACCTGSALVCTWNASTAFDMLRPTKLDQVFQCQGLIVYLATSRDSTVFRHSRVERCQYLYDRSVGSQ